jgi:hypothetical protein
MPSLLDLPGELLQQIISLTLQPPFHLPTSPESIKPEEWIISGQIRRNRRNYTARPDRVINYYRKSPTYSLSLTCRHINMETADVWKREGDKLSCEIDVMVMKDTGFLVTWLMYPKRMVDMSDGGWKMGKVDIGLRFPEGQLESGRFKRRF